MSSAPAVPRAAVLLIYFNRPDCVERVMAAVRRARPPRLYLATDAPRPGHPTDAARCAAARAIVDRGIDWPCEVRRDVAPENLGPTPRITSAISWVFTHEDRAIILEEDCVPGEAFFPFCDELLARYAEDDRVAMISGAQFVPGGWRGRDDASYAFVRLSQIWGWATWRRAWTRYDPAMSGWPDARRNRTLDTVFRSRHDRRYWTRRFDAVHAGTLDVWDYRWACARWLHGQVSVVPSRNLVSYVGFRPDALHTTGDHPAANLPTHELARPLRHPAAVTIDHRLDARTARILFWDGNWFTYQWSKVVRLFRRKPKP